MKCIPGAQIREVRASGVKMLKEAIRNNGFHGSAIIVNEITINGSTQYRVIDGMHRVTALNELSVEYPKLFKGCIFIFNMLDAKILVNVYLQFERSEEIFIANSKFITF